MSPTKKRINTRTKMYRTNAIIKEYLIGNGYEFIYLFPHMRFMKDYVLNGSEFDAIGWKKGDKRVHLFQFKTNKACPKKVLENYRKLNKKYYCVPCWVSYMQKTKEVKCWKVV